MRDYGKVNSSFWTSESIRSLSDDGRMLSLYLLTSPHANMTGCFRLPDGYVCEDLQWDKNRVSEGFEELSRNGFAIRDKATRWVLIPGYLEWNGFENPNVAIAALKLFRDIPDKIAIKSQLADGMRQAISRFEPGKLNGFERVLEGFQTVVGTPEPEPEPEPEPDPISPSSSPKKTMNQAGVIRLSLNWSGRNIRSGQVPIRKNLHSKPGMPDDGRASSPATCSTVSGATWRISVVRTRLVLNSCNRQRHFSGRTGILKITGIFL